MKGKVCLVTGANGGLGKATATALAQLGATVTLACRDKEREKGQRRMLFQPQVIPPSS